MCRPEKCARQVRQSEQPWTLAHKLPLLGKRQNKMQEQCRLQDPRDDVAPVNDPIEIVQFAGVLERIRDERNQAENVKVRGARRGPAPQQNVHADSQINQGDQPQPNIQRAVGRNQNHARIQRHRLPDQRVRGLRPDARMVELAFQPGGVLDFLAIDRNQLVAGLDAAFAPARSDRTVGDQASILFGPAHAVVGGG